MEINSRVKVVVAAFALVAAGGAQGANIYVDRNCPGTTHTGTSWATAYLDLNPVLVATASGNTINVARGVYKPTTGTDRSVAFVMKNGVTLYGGYPTGGGTRDAAANPTVLSGDLAGNDTTDASGVVLSYTGIVGTDNSWHVVRAEGTNATAVLDGFLVTAGLSDQTGSWNDASGAGAGLFAFGSNGGSPTVTGVVFRGNHALGGGGGAAIYGGSPVFTNVTFRGNAADQGGGFYGGNNQWWTGSPVPGSMTMTNVVFQENAAYESTGAAPFGGGMATATTTNTLSNVQFLANTSTGGGAGLDVTDSVSTLSNVLFDGNNDTAANSGGGGMAHECTGSGTATSTLTDVTFRNNHSQWGGGMHANCAGVSLNRVMFLGNTGSPAGGMSIYGAATITDTLFAGNSADTAGGIWTMANTTLTNVTIAGNRAAGIYRNNGTLTVRNSILWGNGGAALSGAATVSYSIVQGTSDAANHVYNIDPLFVTPVDPATAPTTAGDLHLLATSPAIDAGNNNVTSPSLPATDLDGKTRRVDTPGTPDTGSGTPPIVDFGAYEYQAGPSQSADLAITKTDGVTSAVPGGSVTYTITASNAGPSNAPGATVADTFPAILTPTWTCIGAGGATCTASGAGNINDTVNLPAGGSVTYTASASINASATGTLSNTATVAAPGGVTDPNPGNNSATDSDTLNPQADLAITKTDGVTSAVPGGSVTYTITASNAGPSNAPGAAVADTFPASLTATWTCVGAGGGTCTASGWGNINDTVNLPAGGSVTYTASASINASATGTLSNTATVAAPGGVTDPNPGNNSATDSDTLTPDTAPPVVTPPAAIAIDQTLCCGTFGGASPNSSADLLAFVNGGSATDDRDPSPTRLTARIGSTDVTGSTCFEAGTTTVTFRFQDDAGNVGTATSQATVRMFGDLNLDATVDPSDFVVMRAYFNFVIAPGTPPFNAPLGSADLDHNTVVDPSDMVLLRSYFNFAVGCLAP